MLLKDGFANERMCVLPRPLVREASQRIVTRRLVVTDAGWYPKAENHARFRPHGATESIVIVCVAGSGWLEMGPVHSRVPAGAALVIPAGTPHAYGAAADDPWTIWWLHVRGSDVEELLDAIDAPSDRPVIPVRSLDRCVDLIEEIVRTLERDQSTAGLLASAGAAWRLLTQIAVDSVLPDQDDPLERAMTYLAEHLDRPVPVPQLARHAGVSASHLGALFRRATGGGVLAHHTALRMARARQLLDRSTMPVQTIAAEVGYADPFYFSRHFRRIHGLSPSQYRDERKG